MRIGWPLILTTLFLAACHGKPEAHNESASSSIVIPDAEENAAVEATSNAARNPAPGVAAPSSPASHAIPAAFHGRWALVAGDCGPDASIAKGLLVINGAILRFYESVGKPAVVTYPTPSRMEGRFSFSGEGSDWDKDMVLELKRDGATLVRTEKNPVASYTYKRCPA